MLEGSSHHHMLNLKDTNKTRNSNFDENFSPVIEKLEENSSQSNEEQKMFSKQSGIKNDDFIFNNKTQLKDSVISKILFNLDNKENKGNKTLILKSKSLLNSFSKNALKPKKSLKNLSRRNNLFSILEKPSINEIPPFNLIKPKASSPFNLISPHKRNNNKKESILMVKSKRKTVAFPGMKKRSSHFLNNIIQINNLARISDFQQPKDIRKKTTYNDKAKYRIERNSCLQTTETNQKLLHNYTNPTKKQSGVTLENSRLSEDFRFSSLIKKNKIQMVRGLSLKNSRRNLQNNANYIESILNDPNIRKKDVLLKRIKIYSFIQSLTSLVSILLNIIDLELYNKYSNDYIKDNNIEFKNSYEIKNREINSNENTVRILNGIFSFTCLLMTICIFVSKYNFNKKENEKLLNRRNRNSTFFHDININKPKISKINKQDQVSKLILRCLINFLFYPPKINYIYYSYSDTILFIYPLNSFFLLLSSLKLYNIYRCIFYFIPVTSTIGKTICQKHNVKLNIIFMFRTFLSKHKITFPLCIIIILVILISILLRSIEIFSYNINLLENPDVNNKFLINYHEYNIYETSWIYLSFLMRNPVGLLNPETPFGKILLFIIFIIGTLFLLMIYFRINQLMELDRPSFQAYSQLEKLFLPENKENKASEVIFSFILLKKYYSKYNTEEFEKKVANEEKNNINNNNNKRRKSILEFEINKLREKNLLKIKQKKIFFLLVKFHFYLKFFTDIYNYVDSYKISRKQPLKLSSLFQNIEGKMDDNLDSINVKLSSIDSIENIFDRLKKNDIILLKKIKTIKKHDNLIMKYLSELNNYQYRFFNEKRNELKDRKGSLRRSKTKIVYNYKSCKSITNNLN